MANQATVYAVAACVLVALSLPVDASADVSTYSFKVLYSTGQNGVLDVASNGAATGSVLVGQNGQATLWSPGGTPVTLDPSTFNNASIVSTNGVATDGTQVVGPTGSDAPFYWNTNTGVATLLTPAGALNSTVRGVSGNEQVGGAQFGPSSQLPSGQRAAVLWMGGSASSAINLTPTQVNGVFAAIALGTDGTRQVGQVADESTNPISTYAGMWSGTAASFVSLNPTNLTYITGQSQALAVAGGQEVGSGSLSLNAQVPQHPLLWIGENNNAIDLLPVGFDDGVAYGTNGLQQVGSASATGGQGHAMVWSGTAASAVDLQNLLPASYVGSTAFSIDGAGDVFGAATDAAGNSYVIEWSPVPEPGSLAIVIVAGCAMYRRRR